MIYPDFSKAKSLIIGDIMLDKYHSGKVSRISPEAPVPVIKVDKSHFAIGGAGNVANNIAHLHGNAVVIGFVGRDNNKSILSNLLDKISVKSILIETEMPTITKVRIIGEHQQIVRLDFEEVVDICQHYSTEIITNVNKWVDKVNSIIISDYDKGVCSLEVCRCVINAANKKNVFVIIDPKGRNWEKYRNATVVKPNIKELSFAVGKEIANEDSEIERCGIEILKKYGLKYLLVTRSGKGMSLISHQEVMHFPTEAKEVFDVSGAGDTVAATLACAVASGLDIIPAVNLANKAAGIVVTKMGTAPIEYDELFESIKYNGNKKIVSFKRLEKLLLQMRTSGNKIVFTNGCFDILHRGHITYLEEAKKLGDVLIVGLNSDDSIRALKGNGRPINRQDDRAILLSYLQFVDYVVFFEDVTPINLIKTIMPDVLVKGGDYKIHEIVGKEYAKETVVIPLSAGYSTTALIEKILQKEKTDGY